jgi:SAM-dependent methyltransferase
MRVDRSNRAQRDYWDGEDGGYWVRRAERFNLGVVNYCRPLMAAAAIQPSEAVLDIGCGTGETTRLAARYAASAFGVDLSAEMIEFARRQAALEDVRNVTFAQADAQVCPFGEESYAVAISRHGAMFFGDPEAAFANIATALRPGGRLALLSWQPSERNEWQTVIRAALSAGREPPPSPGSLKDPDQVTKLLTAAGFTEVRITSVTVPMYFGHDPDDAYRFLAGQHARTLDAMAPDDRARALESLHAGMTSHQTDRGVWLGSASWLIEARRAPMH